VRRCGSGDLYMVDSYIPAMELDAGMIRHGSTVEISPCRYYAAKKGDLHVTLPELAKCLDSAGATLPPGTGHFTLNSLEISARLRNGYEYVVVIHGDIGLPLCSFTTAERGTVEFCGETATKILNGNLPPYDLGLPLFPVEYLLHNSSLLCFKGGMIRNYGVYLPLSQARESFSGPHAGLQDLLGNPLAVARAGAAGLRGLFNEARRRQGSVVNLHRLGEFDEGRSIGYLLRLTIDDSCGTTVTIDGKYDDYDSFRFIAVNGRSAKSPQQYSR